MCWLPSLLSCLLLVGCITAWEQDASGIYPNSLGARNGVTYFIGYKWSF